MYMHRAVIKWTLNDIVCLSYTQLVCLLRHEYVEAMEPAAATAGEGGKS